jgi:hypothetical protein
VVVLETAPKPLSLPKSKTHQIMPGVDRMEQVPSCTINQDDRKHYWEWTRLIWMLCCLRSKLPNQCLELKTPACIPRSMCTTQVIPAPALYFAGCLPLSYRFLPSHVHPCMFGVCVPAGARNAEEP